MLRATDWRYFRAWVFGALGWGCLSLIVLMQSSARDNQESSNDIWFVFSLLWAEFAFAGIFSCLRHGRWQRLIGMLLVTALPPLCLRLILLLLSQ